MKVYLLGEAETDVRQAAEWYEDQSDGLGAGFVAAVRQVFERIEVGPLRYPVRYRDLRRALVRRFPYAVYYKPVGDDVIVFAVLYQARDIIGLAKRLGSTR